MAQKLSENIIINAQNVNKILDKNAHLLYFFTVFYNEIMKYIMNMTYKLKQKF
jgi:hypothetical protein